MGLIIPALRYKVYNLALSAKLLWLFLAGFVIQYNRNFIKQDKLLNERIEDEKSQSFFNSMFFSPAVCFS